MSTVFDRISTVPYDNNGVIFLSAEAPYTPGETATLLYWEPPTRRLVCRVVSVDTKSDPYRYSLALLVSDAHTPEELADFTTINAESSPSEIPNPMDAMHRLVECEYIPSANDSWRFVRFRDDLEAADKGSRPEFLMSLLDQAQCEFISIKVEYHLHLSSILEQKFTTITSMSEKEVTQLRHTLIIITQPLVGWEEGSTEEREKMVQAGIRSSGQWEGSTEKREKMVQELGGLEAKMCTRCQTSLNVWGRRMEFTFDEKVTVASTEWLSHIHEFLTEHALPKVLSDLQSLTCTLPAMQDKDKTKKMQDVLLTRTDGSPLASKLKELCATNAASSGLQCRAFKDLEDGVLIGELENVAVGSCGGGSGSSSSRAGQEVDMGGRMRWWTF
ncbi:hypothetical protein HDV00_008532 [Rhizophlyctis rosea]|nr:hypothetical protein HDV00_008532 [Rhizophlyctis rosea]